MDVLSSYEQNLKFKSFFVLFLNELFVCDYLTEVERKCSVSKDRMRGMNEK